MTAARSVTAHWWMPLLRGLVALAFGICAFIYPFATAAAFVILFGAYALVDGVIVSVSALRFARPGSRHWLWMLAQGILGILIGGLTFVYPGITALTLSFFVAIWAISTGVLEIGAAMRLRRDVPGEIFLIAAGVLSIMLGLFLAVVPFAGLIVAVYVTGVYAILTGSALLALSARLHAAHGKLGAA